MESAESPEWIDWLDRRRHLDSLSPKRKTTQQVATLSHWLARKFAATNPDAVFAFLIRQGNNIVLNYGSNSPGR